MKTNPTVDVLRCPASKGTSILSQLWQEGHQRVTFCPSETWTVNGFLPSRLLASVSKPLWTSTSRPESVTLRVFCWRYFGYSTSRQCYYRWALLQVHHHHWAKLDLPTVPTTSLTVSYWVTSWSTLWKWTVFCWISVIWLGRVLHFHSESSDILISLIQVSFLALRLDTLSFFMTRPYSSSSLPLLSTTICTLTARAKTKLPRYVSITPWYLKFSAHENEIKIFAVPSYYGWRYC